MSESDTLFHGVRFDPRDRSSRTFGREELESVLADDPVFCWIDVQGPQIESLNELLRLREIDLKLVSHFDAPEILPRIVEAHRLPRVLPLRGRGPGAPPSTPGRGWPGSRSRG